MQDRYITINGIRIRYWMEGEQGDYIVLVHGIGGCVEYWQHNIATFAKSHRVIALDLLGFGDTDKPEINYDLSVLANFIKDFLQHLQISQAHFIGHSMGGGVCLELAFQFPELVNKLILVSNIGFSAKLPLFFRLLNIPLLGEYLLKPNRRNLEAVLSMHVYDSKCINSEFIDCIHKYNSLGANRTILSFVRNNTNLFAAKKKIWQSFEKGLPQIKMPTFIIWGKQDNLLPVNQAYLGQQQLSHAKLYIFDNCRHIPQIEHANEFNELVISYLAHS